MKQTQNVNIMECSEINQNILIEINIPNANDLNKITRIPFQYKIESLKLQKNIVKH